MKKNITVNEFLKGTRNNYLIQIDELPETTYYNYKKNLKKEYGDRFVGSWDALEFTDNTMLIGIATI